MEGWPRIFPDTCGHWRMKPTSFDCLPFEVLCEMSDISHFLGIKYCCFLPKHLMSQRCMQGGLCGVKLSVRILGKCHLFKVWKSLPKEAGRKLSTRHSNSSLLFVHQFRVLHFYSVLGWLQLALAARATNAKRHLECSPGRPQLQQSGSVALCRNRNRSRMAIKLDFRIFFVSFRETLCCLCSFCREVTHFSFYDLVKFNFSFTSHS